MGPLSDTLDSGVKTGIARLHVPELLEAEAFSRAPRPESLVAEEQDLGPYLTEPSMYPSAVAANHRPERPRAQLCRRPATVDSATAAILA